MIKYEKIYNQSPQGGCLTYKLSRIFSAMNRTGTTFVFDLSWLAERIKRTRAVKSQSSALLDIRGAINSNCFNYTWRFLCA